MGVQITAGIPNGPDLFGLLPSPRQRDHRQQGTPLPQGLDQQLCSHYPRHVVVGDQKGMPGFIEGGQGLFPAVYRLGLVAQPLDVWTDLHL